MSKKEALLKAQKEAAEKTSHGGRPSKFATADMRLVRYMALKGATDEEIATECEVHIQTVYKWKREHPEFFNQLKEWKDEADSKVERSLYERATGYSCKETKMFCHEGMIVAEDMIKHYPPDPTSCIFWLKNRKPNQWRDRIENVNTNTNLVTTVEEFLKSVGDQDGQGQERQEGHDNGSEKQH